MTQASKWLVLVGLCLAMGGCVSSSVEQLRQAPIGAGIRSGESVVVLGRRQHGQYQTEAGFADCVADDLAAPGIKIYPRRKFENALFPWFEPRTAPLAPDALPKLLADPAIARRLRRTGVRYVVWLDGRTRRTGGGGSMGCAVGPGGGGCLGFVWWEKRAQYKASIWDLEDYDAVGQVNVNADGTSYMPALILPIPLIARTQSAACSGIAKQLREVLKPSAS